MRYEYRTPGTTLWWASIGEWIACAHRLDRRRSSAARHRALAAHAACLPSDLIAAETDIATIDTALRLLKYGPPSLARPPRGGREGHPTTRVIVDLMNRRAGLMRAADEIPEGGNWRTTHSRPFP